MDKYLQGSSWFSQYPTVIKNEGKIGDHIYAVSAGENNNALYYDKAFLQKAGIKVPWQPKTWADIITAAKAIKKAEPKIIPLWTDAGTSAGPNGAGYGILNLLAGSDTPTIQTSSGKMVVSSKGLLETLNWYHEVFADGLGAPISDLFSENNAPNIPSALFAKGQLGIAVGANFLGGNWTKMVSFPYWPQAGTAIGVAGLPKINGGGYASTLSGWDFGISSHTNHPQAAAELINVMQEPTNMIEAANWAGWVPPVKSYWSSRPTRTSPPRSTRPSATCCPGRASSRERQLLGVGAGDRGGLRRHRRDAQHHGRAGDGPDEGLCHQPAGTERGRLAPIATERG